MKENRNDEIKKLAENLELVLNQKNKKMIAFTTDCKKYSVLSLINELASIYKAYKKVLVCSYVGAQDRIGGVDYYTVAESNDIEKIAQKCSEYDIVLFNCPNVIDSFNYLHLAHIVDEMVIVAKKWESKTENICKIKELLIGQNVDLVGIVYQN